MNILIINGSVEQNELNPYWIVSIDANMSIDKVVSILQLPSDYQLVLYNNQQAQKVIDIKNILLNDTYPVITVMDNCSYSIDHGLDSYSQFMLSNMFEPDNVEDITLEATNKFFSSIEDIANKCNSTSKDIINHLLSDPTKFYIVYGILSNLWNIDGDDWNKIYINAAKDGYTPILDKLELDKKPLSMNTYKEALEQAAGSGHKEIVIRMINHISKITVNDNKQIISAYNDAMEWGAEGGRIDIVQLMLERGANNYDRAMAFAAKRGHMDIVKLMLNPDQDNSNIGADNYNLAMIEAAKEGHIDIVRFMLDRGADDYNLSMALAAEGGHMDIVRLMLKPDPDDYTKGANDYNWGMVMAAGGGHIDIVRLMLDRGANNYNGAMSYAASEGHINIVQLMLHPDPDNYNIGANNHDDAMIEAAKEGNIDIVQLMLESGANDYDYAIELAAPWGHIETIDLIKKWRSAH